MRSWSFAVRRSDGCRSVLGRALAVGALALPAFLLPAGPAAAAVGLRWTAVSAAFDQPTQVTSPVDGSGRIFVVQKTGQVRVVKNGVLQATPFLDLRTSVSSAGERGMTSIAFASNFRVTSYVFVAFTDLDGSLRVVRWHLRSPDSPTVDYATAKVLMIIPHPGHTNHNGGQLLYRWDATLLITTGDGGGGGDLNNNAQNGRSLLGKVLRIDPWHSCGAAHYCIPADNPFAANFSGVRRELFHWGLRNPWRASLDAATHYLWIGDVGQDRYEEIDAAAPTAHLNFGWSCLEGTSVFNAARCTTTGNYTSPLGTYAHPIGEAIIGGFVYRGAKYPAVRGKYVYGDYASGRVWLLPVGQQPQLLPGLTSFGEVDGRELYATTIDGRLWRMSYS